MSYRTPGQTVGEEYASIEQDIRYLYKCCERGAGNGFTVGAAGRLNLFPPTLTNRWYSRLGQSTLTSLFASVTIAPTLGVHVIEARVNEVAVGSVTIALGDLIGASVVTPAVTLGPTDYLTFSLSGESTYQLFVEGIFDGVGCGSGGLEWYPGGD